MDMMTRRRAMMGAEAGEPAPLYSFYQCDVYKVVSDIWYGGDGNHIYSRTSANSRGPIIYKDKVTGTYANWGAYLFSLAAGDEVEIVIKNFNYTINNTNENSKWNLRFYKDSSTATTVFNALASDRSFTKGTSGTIDELRRTVTIEEACNIRCMYSYTYRAATFEFDLEVWVNGVRYL